MARLTARGTLIATLTLVVLLGQRAAVVVAHPLDEYLQAMYVTLAPASITVELDLTPGVLVAPQVAALIDTDGDGTLSDAEGQAYAHAVLGDILLEVDRRRYPLALTKVELPPMLALTAGMGTIRLTAATNTVESDGSPVQIGPRSHQAFIQNTHAPVKSVYQATAVLPQAGGVEVAQQRRDDLQQGLRVEYAVAPLAQADVGATAGAGAVPPGGTPEGQRWLVDTLYQPTVSPWLLLVALALAAMLGGLHALTPGHGKTLLASYLVGSRGTVRHAVVLGGTVTVTHTASVIATGLLALLAGHLVVPDLLVPTLELGSGLLVILLGARLVWLRWRSPRHGCDHAHDHVHDGHDHVHSHERTHHGHGHEHAEHAHEHGHLPRPHPTEGAEAVRWRDLATMGVSGGMTPCPEAIGILLVAIGLNRIVLGLGLIVAFSLGLAAVLCLLGLLIVRSSGLVDRLGTLGQRTQRLLPLGSAVVVTVLGAVTAAKGVMAYLA